VIPRRIFHKDPEETSEEVESFWDGVKALHPYTRPELRHADHKTEQPWAFGAHHWAASWVEPSDH
jgi:hypothetical protein